MPAYCYVGFSLFDSGEASGITDNTSTATAAMSSTRSSAAAAAERAAKDLRIQELETKTAGLDRGMTDAMAELTLLRSERAAAGAPAPTPVMVTSQLRAPAIERFSGDRERSSDFLLAMDRRLEASN